MQLVGAGAVHDRAARRVRDQRPKKRTLVRASSGWRPVNLAELWQRRELLFQLVRRDVSVRYKQTALGLAWAVLQPVAAMAAFSLVFGRLIGVPSDGVPYPLFALAGLLPWTYFATAVAHGSTSLVANTSLISKVYFPRLIIPLASALAPAVDLAVGLLALLVVLIVARLGPGWQISLLPLFALMAIAAALAVTVWAAALDVQYRDVRYVVPFVVQVLMFVTPVVYPASLVDSSLHPLLGLNPMAGVVEGWRWSLLGRPAMPWSIVVTSSATTTLLLVGGVFYFRRVERGFADVI